MYRYVETLTFKTIFLFDYEQNPKLKILKNSLMNDDQILMKKENAKNNYSLFRIHLTHMSLSPSKTVCNKTHKSQIIKKQILHVYKYKCFV